MRAAAGAGAGTRTGTSSSELSSSSALKCWDKPGAPVGNPVPEHPQVTPGMGWEQGLGSTLRAVLWGSPSLWILQASCCLPAETSALGAGARTGWGTFRYTVGLEQRGWNWHLPRVPHPRNTGFGTQTALVWALQSPGVLRGTSTESRVNHCRD